MDAPLAGTFVMTPPRRNRNWIWFFVTLAVLTGVATVTLIVYNLRQQLTLSQLRAARDLWEQKRPSDYRLEYTKKGSATGTFVVEVRGGKAVSVLMDGRPILQDEKPLDKELIYRYDMTALFNDIEQFLEIDARPGSPRAYNRAYFDPDDGHLLQYVRRIMGTTNRLEITVQLRPLSAESGGDR
jgi:hypothetical protein